MKKLIMVMLALLLLPALAACSKFEGKPTAGSPEITYNNVPPTLNAGQGKVSPNSMVASAPAPASILPARDSVDNSTTDRMIVRNGSVSLLVEDIPISLDKISEMAYNLKGYVVSSQSWRENERYYGSIAIRVPVAEFDNVMRLLAAMAVEVKTQSSSSQDVTAEYIDLSAKLKTLEATEQQLLAIMKQATEIKDVLAVQSELTNIRTQIEQTKGRMQYLERTSATSLISINLEQSKLSVNISADRASVKMNEMVYFTSQVFGGFTPYSYEWDFGDGSTGTVAQPSHKYSKAGTYTVSVKVSDDKGNSYTEARKDYITVLQSGWSIGDVVSGAWQGLVWLGEALVTLVIGLAVFSPVWIIIGVIIWLIRRKKKSAAR